MTKLRISRLKVPMNLLETAHAHVEAVRNIKTAAEPTNSFSDTGKKDEKEEKCGKVWKIIGICAAVVVALGGIGFLVYKLFANKTDDYDLYDDLDNYYVDDDFDKDQLTEDLSDGISEADFAE